MGKKILKVGLGGTARRKMRNKIIINPYGNVYRRRRSISCPSTPIRSAACSTNVVLMAVSEILEREYHQYNNDHQSPQRGNVYLYYH